MPCESFVRPQLQKPLGCGSIGRSLALGCGHHRLEAGPRVLKPRSPSAGGRPLCAAASVTIGRWQALGCGSLGHHRLGAGPRVLKPRTPSGCLGHYGAGASVTIGMGQALCAEASVTIGWRQALSCGSLAHHRVSRALWCGSLGHHRYEAGPRVLRPRTPSAGGRPLGAGASFTIGMRHALVCGSLDHPRRASATIGETRSPSA